jgi:hypothetical protein
VHTPYALPFGTLLSAASWKLPASQPSRKHLAWPLEKRCQPGLQAKCVGSQELLRAQAEPSAGHAHFLRQL